ncbi:AGAP002274-PB [Anopheles gambiae str. PEST]|uniref:AGAP002274-PB n=1 Tax=Anopheles gambiae TaxID=7165 RepID=F5HIS0_ANOGA|nr:AGAP002274-PB [Anopheles gambiae str. PEST]
MADIPLISITQECSDDEELSTSSATNKLNIEDALTDTEDLMMDGAGQRERKSASSSPVPPEPNSLSLLEALQSPLAGAVTDVEDCSDTSDEEERDKKPTREVDISLDDFLDQGYVDEMTKSDQRGAKPKILTRSCSKAAEGPSSKSLMVCADVAAALTDCEDCAMSGEDGDTSVVPDCPDDILMRQDADNGMVDIHNAVRRRQDKHLPRAEQQAAQSSSSDSDEPECKVVRHRKPHRKGVVEQRSNISDCENILVSEEESSSLAKPGPASAFEADEVTMEASDHETEQSVTFPEINICFVTDGDAGDEPAKQCSSRPSTLTVGQANADEAVTDVENLDSSDSETSAPQRSKRLMPRAVARGGKGGGLTDVEDFNASDEEQDGQSPQDVGGEEHSFLPSPTREIAIMRGDGSGEQTANVMPLNHTYLLARTPDIEQALTDFEDLAVNDDEKLYDDAKYTIEALPEMDNDTVYASENTPAPPKPNWLDQAHEPLTDTEDIFFDRAAGSGPGAAVSFGSNELRRRRKPKGTAATQSYKGKTFLDTSATGQENGSAAATTDVEDLYLSDDDAAAVSSFPPTDRSKQRRATIQVPPQHHTGDSAKTDIEYLSGDEYVSDRTVPSPTVCPDGFHSTIKSRDRLGGGRSGQQALGVPGCPAPTISRTSPTPDGANCHTDCEEIQGASDEEEETMDGAAKRDPEQESMARTATPFELRRALDESGSCEIHDALVGSTRRHRGDRKREDDGYLVLVRSEAGRLVDDVLEQSVSIVSSSQGPGPMTIDRDLQQPSESEQYAIRSDILSSTDGDLVVKSPTIESMSGKSFDDNMSNPEYDALLLGTAGGQPMSQALGADDNAAEDEGSDAKLTADGAGTVATATKDQAAESARRAKKIDRKYARLSADLGPEALLDKNQEYDEAISQIKDEVSMLQSEYSKMSWDESVSMTTGDFGSSTPDNDLQETDLQQQTENNIPQTTTPRLVSQTVEAAAPPASAVSDAFVSGQCVAIAATSTSTVTTTAANLLTDANDVATADQCFTASAAIVERTEQSVLSTTTSTIGSISNAEQSFSIASTEPDRPSESSSSGGGGGGFDGQPVPKPRTSISSRTDTATRSSLLESFEHQDSIEQYPEPAPVQSAEPDLRLRQGSITSDELSNVAQKDSSELVTSEEDISSGAKFFIGECSSDIITRSSTEKRSDFAFDNEGYTFSQESQGTDDQESRRDAMEAYQQQIRLEDGFTLDSLKELDIAGLQSSGKPPVVHSPVTAPATVQPSQSVKSEVDVGEATILESTTTEQQEQQQQYAHMTIDELTIAKTLEEVKESLDAVQEELIEAVTDGTPIKQSPSEFEFKILPSTRYVQDPIYETNQEEAVAVSTATAAAITTTTIVSESGLSDSETRSVAAAATAPPIKIDEAPTAAGSSDSSQLEASPRLRHGPAAAKGNRWSATDVDSSGESHYQSFEHTDSSRPLSSDLEQVLPYASSEYETALDHSMVPTSLGTEYHSAVSTLHSYAVSSHDSMKSFDSESSGNLASIESEATETLVPSTMDVDFDSSDAALIHDDSEDDLRDKLLLLDDKEEPSSAASSSVPIAMKRSHEMDFAELKGESVADESLLQFGEQRSHGVESVSSSFQEEKLLSSSIGTARDLVEAMQATSLEDVKTEPADDGKLGTSLEDGSILSISLSSASNLETIMENLSDKTTSAGPVPTHVEIGLDAVTPTTAGTTAGYIGDITLTSTTLKEGDVNFLNTQATTEMIEVSESAELIAGREDSEETVRKRGHKRTESTAIISGKFMAEMGENRDSIESQDESLSQDASKPPTTSSERDETRDESSDSDYDRYESEYARSFRAPVAQSKKKDKKAGDVFEKDFELDRRNSFSPSQSVIETIVEDVHAEIEQGDEAQQIMVSKSQRLQEYRESSTHNIPDIHVTEDFAEQQQQQSSDGEDEAKREVTVFSETVSVVETVTKTQADATVSSSATTVRKVTTETASTSAGMTMAKQTGIQYAKQEEFQLTEEQYQELIEQKYKAKLADSTTKYAFDADDKDDSAGSDSFEMLEQPDISDEFVIVEEVAREAHEFDAEGKSVAIKPTKIEKKHDEDVEKILVKSAPAHTNAGSLYAANMRDDMMYEFEESPPTGGAEGVDGGAGVTMDLLNNGYPLEESKRWVEMQLAETQNFRYPYEDRLEDIKEEDTDFEVGSSRIGSIKDSFSSTPDYDLLAKRMASREHDDISMSSLQEFENLEHVISLENRKMQQGSQDSLSNGSFTRRFMQRGMHGDDISLSSLKEFEGLENACLEAHLIEIKAKEEAALLLSRSDESNKSNGSNGAKRSPPSNGAAAVGSHQQSTEGAAATKIISSSTSITTTVVGGAVGSSVPSGEMTKVERKITTASGSGREGSSTTTVTTITHVEGQTRQGLDEEDSTSHHILTVSSDSLDGTRVKQPLASGRDALPSAHSSSDSLDMHSKNNVDPMTSSIDSIEFSKTGIATTRSSQSDSIEQMAQQQQQPNRSDSTDSIEAQQQLQQQQKLQHHQTYHQTTTQQTLSDTKRDSLESLAASSSDNQSGFSSPTKSAHGSRPLSDSGVGASGTTAHHQQQLQQQQFHHQTTTMSTHTVSTGGRTMQKDISADSLTGPDAAFLTSTESLETSSTATNATYQNETDSQMSSSVTSCDSITMVDTVGPSQSLEHWDSSFTAGVHGGGFGASTLMTSSSMSAYSSGVVGSSGGTTIQQQQQQHAFRTSHAEASSSIRMSSSSTSSTSSSTVTMVASSASSTSVRTAQQQLMGEREIAFDDVKETSKERMQSKSTEKEE